MGGIYVYVCLYIYIYLLSRASENRAFLSVSLQKMIEQLPKLLVNGVTSSCVRFRVFEWDQGL